MDIEKLILKEQRRKEYQQNYYNNKVKTKRQELSALRKQVITNFRNKVNEMTLDELKKLSTTSNFKYDFINNDDDNIVFSMWFQNDYKDVVYRTKKKKQWEGVKKQIQREMEQQRKIEMERQRLQRDIDRDDYRIKVKEEIKNEVETMVFDQSHYAELIEGLSQSKNSITKALYMVYLQSNFDPEKIPEYKTNYVDVLLEKRMEEYDREHLFI